MRPLSTVLALFGLLVVMLPPGSGIAQVGPPNEDQAAEHLARATEVDFLFQAQTALAFGIGGFNISRAALGERQGRPYRYALGAASLVRGALLMLSTTGHPERDGEQALPSPERAARLLRERARHQRALRVAGGAVQLLAGLAFVPLYLAPNGWQMQTWSNGFAMIGAGISVGLSLLRLFRESDAERQWHAYRDSRRSRLTREEPWR